MRMKFALLVLAIAAIGTFSWSFAPWSDIQTWAAREQRVFQNAMAGALRGIQAGDPLAIWTLCSATAAYGFFHALGPGHGKFLLGGAALASGATLKRLSILTVLSSLAQATTAILLVGSFVVVLRMGSGNLADITENWIAPASYLVISAIGGVLVFRGVRTRHRMGKVKTAAATCCGHAHGPSVDDVATLNSTRDAVALVVSIAMRPCTGALFVLAIAARFDAFAVGCLAVITMGLGTAALNLTVATSGVAARRLAGLGTRDNDGMQAVSAALHITGGALIIVMSIGVLLPSVGVL